MGTENPSFCENQKKIFRGGGLGSGRVGGVGGVDGGRPGWM